MSGNQPQTQMASQLTEMQTRLASQATQQAAAASGQATTRQIDLGEEDDEDDEQQQPQVATNTAQESEEDEETELASETEAAAEVAAFVPFAAALTQELTFVVYPETVEADKMLPGLNYACPFSRKGGTLRLLTDALLPPLKAMSDQNILMLGDASQAATALTPVYAQINNVAFQALHAASAATGQVKGAAVTAAADEEEDSSEDAGLNLPIDDRIYIEGGNVNLTYFTPYPDLQEDAGVKQIENLSIWLSKLNTHGVKINIVFAYSVQDLLDSSVNTVLNAIVQTDALDASIYLAKTHAFEFAPELIEELTGSFAAFLVVSTK